MEPSVLIAIGGNSLLRAGEPATVQAERAHVTAFARAVADVVAGGWHVVLTHGNGPQVGAELLRSECAPREAYPLPLDVCVACTQGEIGFLLQQAVTMALAARGIARPAVTLLTQVVVAANDPAFSRPSKPIGPYYTSEAAETRRREGWSLVEIPGRGFRRVVASPEPQQIVEQDAIQTLVEAGDVVIALGGGGIPVVRTGGELKGIEAVIDKDLASAVLAARLGVDAFVIATDVDRIYLDYGRPQARGLDVVRTPELRRYAAAGMFPPGSMGPKVEAALRFIEGGGREAIVTSHEYLAAALGGRGGTHIIPGRLHAAEDGSLVGAAAGPGRAGGGHSRRHSGDFHDRD
jgi:carbamate kinase